MSEDRSAQGTGEKADAVGSKRGDRAQRRIGQRKEQLVEDERAGRAVDEKIVPLDRRADDAGNDDALDFGRSLGRTFGDGNLSHDAHDRFL